MDTAYSVTIPGFWLNGKFYPEIRGGSDQSGSGSSDGSSEGAEGEGSGGTSTENEGEGSGDGEKKFTQEEVNALLSREISKKTRGTLKPEDLGFKSRQELEDAIKAANEASEASKTEQEKAIEAARKEAADGAKAEVLTKAQSIMLKADFKVKATAAGVQPNALDDAYAVATLTGEWKDGVSIDEDGEVTGLDDDFFKKFKDAKPFLFGEVKEGVGNIGAGARSANGALQNEDELRKKYTALGTGG